MGLIADTLGAVRGLLPERKIAVGAAVQTWEAGTPQRQREPYYRLALEGYSQNELVFACVEELSTSAAEPRLVAVRKTADGGKEQLKDHPILDLLERPNPFTSHYSLIASMIMYRAIAGNAYLEKARSAAGRVVELWPLRPDRMWVIPDRVTHIRGWEYKLGAETFTLPASDVIHSKTRNPLDDWYGLPPLQACAQRVDTDNFMRSFTASFFRNAGVPAGLLTIEKQVGQAEAQMIRDRFKNEFGGSGGWHSLMVLANQGSVSYQAMGLPLGERGLVLPELDEIHEARIPMVFGVPLELIGARLGMVHGNRSTTREARAGFWDETLAPLYQELAADLTLGLRDEYGDFDYLEFDLSTVRALQEDESMKVDRVVKKLQAALCSVQEGRAELGYTPGYEAGAILALPASLHGLPADTLDAPPAPPVAAAPADSTQPQDTQSDLQPAGKTRITLLEPRALAAPEPSVVNVYQSDGKKTTVTARKIVHRDEDGRVTGVTEYREEEAV